MENTKSLSLVSSSHYEEIYKACYLAYEAACNERVVDPAYGYASPYVEEFDLVWKETKIKEFTRLLKTIISKLK